MLQPGPNTRGAPVVLVVDDDPAEQELTRRIFARSLPTATFDVVGDGPAALAWLRADHRARPTVVIVDLNLPGMRGTEIVRAIRTDPHLGHVVTVMQSTSDRESDVADCNAAGAHCFVTKATGMAAMTDVYRRIVEFWFGLARIPSGHRCPSAGADQRPVSIR